MTTSAADTLTRPMTESQRAAALRRTEVLLEVTRKCATMTQIDGVLAMLVELTSRELNCDRGTLFLNDAKTRELYSRFAQGSQSLEIRIPNDSGIAGHVFQTGESLLVEDAYADPRFNSTVDQRTGYKTRNIICVPVRTPLGQIIGVMQNINKHDGEFTAEDVSLLEEMTSQATVFLQSLQSIEEIEQVRTKELAFLSMISEISSEVDLSRLMQRVVAETVRMFEAERATIFIHDKATDTLFSMFSAGGKVNEIRFPSGAGIAGTVFTSGQSLNIPHAYADLRFNPAFDRQTGFFTRCILCVPIFNKQGEAIGVTQVLNKKTGAFTDKDEQQLKTFTGQIANALENSKLFDDVQRIKLYNESVLQSMSNGVITLDPLGKVITCNQAIARIWACQASDVQGHLLADLLGGTGTWIIERIDKVKEDRQSDVFPDANVALFGVNKSVNLTIMPLVAEGDDAKLGSMLMVEDISSAKRMKSTMSRYMDPVIAAQMMDGDALDLLGGVSAEATIMFTDVRGFTTITEEYGAQGTVSFLNEYFSLMVDCITAQGGMLDKFIGDAIMACFGLPVPHDDDPDRAARAAIAMIRTLWEWNAERRDKGLKTVDMGVGIHTDHVVSGNIGSPKRMDYTVIGDGVNLASRLESACKAYSARILASESTISKLNGTYKMRDIDLVVVKGKTAPVRVFELLDYHDPQTFPGLRDVLGHFEDGMTAYRSARWEDAIMRFEKCLSLNPGDGLSRTYIERCLEMQTNPPQGDWDGVWVMKGK
jgi:adenylate cyclase